MDATSYLLGKKSGGGGPTPTGTINITENGQHDVTNYATANVNVSGGEEPTSLGPIQKSIDDYIEYLKKQGDNYSYILNTSATLYTPHIDYTKYVIQKTSTGYRIFWFPKESEIMSITQANGSTNRFAIVINNNILGYGYVTANVYRSSSTYNSLNDAILGIQSNTTTYSTAPNTRFENDSPYIIPCTSSPIINNSTGEVISSRKISSNETIEVIS